MRTFVLALLAIANGMVVISHIGGPTSTTLGSCAQPLRMASVNVPYNNRMSLILDEYLRTSDLDVGFLQEVSNGGRWKTVLESLAAVYPHQVHRGDVAILSRKPFEPEEAACRSADRLPSPPAEDPASP